MWPVPAANVNPQVTSGATSVMFLGLARMIRSATLTSQSMPPAASMTEAAVMTAMMISITSIGGLVGGAPNTKVSTARPTPPHTPRPMPPTRAPMASAPRTTRSSNMNNVTLVLHSQEVQVVVQDQPDLVAHLVGAVIHVGVAKPELQALDRRHVVDDVEVSFAGRRKAAPRRRVAPVRSLHVGQEDAEAG